MPFDILTTYRNIISFLFLKTGIYYIFKFFICIFRSSCIEVCIEHCYQNIFTLCVFKNRNFFRTHKAPSCIISNFSRQNILISVNPWLQIFNIFYRNYFPENVISQDLNINYSSFF